MLNFHFSEEDLERNFDFFNLSKGHAYFQENKVLDLQVRNQGQILKGRSAGDSQPFYLQDIRISYYKGQIKFLGDCSCPIGSDCKHIIALLYKRLEHFKNIPKDSVTDKHLQHWLHALAQSSPPPAPPLESKKPVQKTGALSKVPVFIFNEIIQGDSRKLKVQLSLPYFKKEGTFGKAKPYKISLFDQSRIQELPRPHQKCILQLMVMSSNYSYRSFDHVQIQGEEGASFLELALETGASYWKEATLPLKKGPVLQATFQWNTLANGVQKIGCVKKEIESLPFFSPLTEDPQSSAPLEPSPLLPQRIERTPLYLLPLKPFYYIDFTTGKCGILNFDIPYEKVQLLLQAPPLLPEHSEAVFQSLTRLFQAGEIEFPQVFQGIRKEKGKPIPHLKLYRPPASSSTTFTFLEEGESERSPLILASFQLQYGEDLFYPQEELPSVLQKTPEGGWVEYQRNEEAENSFRHELLDVLFIALKDLERPIPRNLRSEWTMGDWLGELDNAREIRHNWLEFISKHLPAFRERGWKITLDPSFPYQLQENEGWYSNMEEEIQEGMQWFSTELGVMVEGERVNLLPILLQTWIQHPDILEDLESLSEEGVYYFLLEDEKYLELPAKRVHHILLYLKDIYNFIHLNPRGRIPFSHWDVADLLEWNSLLERTGISWTQSESLERLKQRFISFQGIEEIPLPQQFHAELRPYQKQGYYWLHFLRHYEFAGILADDMGLGKTVQTLAYLAYEKEQNRLEQPSLVVAPTSLMVNWRMEAERFTPQLRVLILHGPSRKNFFKNLQDYDLILTTYPLLVRDKTHLAEQAFSNIFLDEAQNIKNPQAKSTQVVYRLQAVRRFCLTGTPIENHLGELWSLFHFLLPGFLGTDLHFKKFYRIPIEKEQNKERQSALARRVKPFLLRRTKNQVEMDLPLKTETLQYCELEKAQRDLYETIRVSMHQKVKDEIQTKGLARSHLMVLEALLRLRQVCCDPRLLKNSVYAKKIKQSAKLELLMELVLSLVEEDRRILLFSQFTSMLELIQEELEKHEIPYLLLTGDTKDRATPIRQFQEQDQLGKRIPLFLISLKAGGTGLNLTRADTVIHYDPWWNPAVENQASDRVHRIGQEKPVFIYKLLTQGTVEEKILELQAKKRHLAEGLFGDSTEKASPLTLEDINALFEPLR